MMRRLRRIAALVLLAAVIVLIFAAWRVLAYQTASSIYPPPAAAVSSDRAASVAARIAAQDTVDRQELAIDLAPSHTASVQLYVDGQNFFPVLLADMQAAQSSIHFEEYGFDPGTVADQFVPVMTDKAQHAVDVRMIVDRFGSGVDGNAHDMYTTLAGSGAQVAVNYPFLLSRVGLFGTPQGVDWRFQQLGHFYHRKMFIIDGQIGWVGGAGLEDWFYDGSFHDVFVRVTGDVVAQLQLTFVTDFRFHGGPLPTGPGALDKYFPEPVSGGSIPTTFVTNVPGEDHRAVTDAIWDLIEHAQTRLDIIDPYVADTGTLDRIMAAARRGVRVRFIVPAASNSPPVQWAFEHHLQEFQDAGVNVYWHPVLPHAKVVLADDRVLVGSTNLDSWALYRNWETSLVLEDAQVAATFESQLFDPDVAASSLATPPTGLARIRDAVAFLFSPLL
ncbi:MAG TPA: phosphatidylserine/phosphatidylglycerophosphate/cardiolipin synthase family protein [Chloroflexota bacterium]|jgi:cardiolipin synthase